MTATTNPDILQKFLFDAAPVRGELVRMEATWQEVLNRHAYPVAVRRVLGEMMAAAALLSANLKFNGALVMQLHGDGPVRMLVIECLSDLSMRATAKLAEDAAIADDATLRQMVNVRGQGRFAITLDPQDKLPGQQPYQGIVPLHGDHREPLQQVAQVLEHYMLQSEQLDTRLVLAADERCAAGLLIQRLPVEGAGNLGSRRAEDDIGLHEGFNRIAMLAATLTRGELLTLEADALLHRLFWQEPLTRFEPLQPRFACRCSRERVQGMLRSLGRAESESLIVERGLVEVGCDFCGLQYRFDAVDVGEMFTPGRDQPPASRAVQ
ncbi:MAG: Hsp33 family molecular chaperone HslO [Cupriavidus sp.]|nr:MAG: Hsp33 family molecular chaperone HslO [Cupriavidus sp.]